jgi:hypothetical protein
MEWAARQSPGDQDSGASLSKLSSGWTEQRAIDQSMEYGPSNQIIRAIEPKSEKADNKSIIH